MPEGLVNLLEYNSARFNSVFDSIKDSRTNILAQNNRQGNYLIDNILIPNDIVNREVIPLLKNYLAVEPLEKKFYMNPHFYCFKTYNCVDLWDIILKINNCLSCEEFVMDNVKYITEEGIQELFLFLKKIADKKLVFRTEKINSTLIYPLKY